MKTRHNPRPQHQGGHNKKAQPAQRQPADTTTGRVVVYEVASTAREIIRVYVETVAQAGQERVIAF